MKKFALVVSKDDTLYTEPLSRLLSYEDVTIEQVYITPSHQPNQNQQRYNQIARRLLSTKFKVIFGWKVLKRQLLKTAFWSSSLRSRSSIKALCAYHNIKCQSIQDVNGRELLYSLKQQGITSLLSITSLIYKPEIIAQPWLTIYNFHPGLLPNNKGRFPIFWAIMKREQQGMTCHEVTEKIDAGRIVFQEIIPNTDNDNVEQVMDKVIHAIPAFIKKSIKAIEDERFVVAPIVLSSFYGPYPSDEDILKYKLLMKSRTKE